MLQIEKKAGRAIEQVNITKSQIEKKIGDEGLRHKRYTESLVLKQRKLHTSNIQLHEKEQAHKIDSLKKDITQQMNKKINEENQIMKNHIEKQKIISKKNTEDLRKKIEKMKKSNSKITELMHKKIAKTPSKKNVLKVTKKPITVKKNK